tara:strand:+ start:499 stop:1179 length:681 start_codon:yes stop_codon:yes gene_type:complete
MTDFDPSRHRIVAVVTDEEDPERGQHFHLSMPDLVREIHETKVIESDSTALQVINDRIDALASRPTPTELIIPKIDNEIPKDLLERMQFIARGLDVLRSKVEALEGQGTITPSDANDLVRSFGSRLDVTIEEKLADAIGDIRSRLSVVEERESPQVAKQLTKLAEAVHAVSDLVSSVEETVEQKSSQLERKYAKIASHINGVEDRVGKLALFGDLLATEVRKIGMA